MKNKNKFTLIILGLVFSVMFLAIAPPEALAASSKNCIYQDNRNSNN